MWCSLEKNWGCETFLHIGIFFFGPYPPRGGEVRKNGDTANFVCPPPPLGGRWWTGTSTVWDKAADVDSSPALFEGNHEFV